MVEVSRFLNVSELAEYMGVGKAAAYELCRRQGFPAIRIGNSIRIPNTALQQWIANELNNGQHRV